MPAGVTALDKGIVAIDTEYARPQQDASHLIVEQGRAAFVDTGVNSSVPLLLSALRSQDLDVAAVDYVFLTHIHLDHAGGAGHFAERFPESLIGVHARGARHLADPTRLWDSAERIYTPEGMQTLWGPMQPVPEDRLLVLDEGSAISLGGGRQLEVMYTPGHAKHHIVFTEEGSGGMFVGDSVGIAFPHGHMVQPVTPPPDFDEPLVVRQLRRMAARQPGFVGFAHYGVTSHVARVFDQAEARLGEWVSFVESLGEAADASDRLRDWVLGAYQSEGIPEEDIDQYDRNTFWPMQVTGIQRWLTQQDDG